MSTKANLSELLADTAGSTRSRKPAAASAAQNQPGDQRGRLLGSHVPAEAKDQFKLLAAEQKKSIDNLHAEALNDLFAKYGKPEICPIKPRTRRKRAVA
jgi:hypothetical protein